MEGTSTKDGQENKNITEQYTGGNTDEVSENELNYDEGADGRVDLAQVGLDSDRIGGLLAWGASYVVCKPPEIEVDGQTYDLRGRYMQSAKKEYAQLADNLGVEDALSELDLLNLTPGQLLGLFGGLAGLTAVRQRKEFQKQVEEIKGEINENGEDETNAK